MSLILFGGYFLPSSLLFSSLFWSWARVLFEESESKQNKMEWEPLLQRRVYDALQRSFTRGCGKENREQLYKEAKELLEKQQYKCALCGKMMSYQSGSKMVASLDRVYSSVKKSPYRKTCGYLKNCRWVCWACNHITRSCHMKNAKWVNQELCKQ